MSPEALLPQLLRQCTLACKTRSAQIRCRLSQLHRSFSLSCPRSTLMQLRRLAGMLPDCFGHAMQETFESIAAWMINRNHHMITTTFMAVQFVDMTRTAPCQMSTTIRLHPVTCMVSCCNAHTAQDSTNPTQASMAIRPCFNSASRKKGTASVSFVNPIGSNLS